MSQDLRLSGGVARPILPQDLRVRLGMGLIWVGAVVSLTTLPTALLAVAVLALFSWLSGPHPGLWHRLMHIEGFVLVLLISLPLTLPGTEIARLGPFALSAEGVNRALLLGARITAAALILLLTFAQTEPMRLGAALTGLHLPPKLVQILVLALRYLGLIREETRRRREAMRARGFCARTNRHSFTSYANLAGMILVGALARAQRVEEAMRMRGFTGQMPAAPNAPISRADIGRLAAAVALAAVLVGADHGLINR